MLPVSGRQMVPMIWSNDTHYLVWLNVEVDAFEHFQLPERLMYVVKGNHVLMCKCANMQMCYVYY